MRVGRSQWVALVGFLSMALIAVPPASAASAQVAVDNSLGNGIATGAVVNGDPANARVMVTNNDDFWVAVDLKPPQGGANLTPTNPLVDPGGIYAAGHVIGPNGKASWEGVFDPTTGGSQDVWVHYDLSTASGAEAVAGTVLQIVASTFGDQLVAPSSQALSAALSAIDNLPDFIDFMQALKNSDVWAAVQHYELLLQTPTEAAAISKALVSFELQIQPTQLLAAAAVQYVADIVTPIFDLIRAGIEQHTSGQVTFSLAPAPSPALPSVGDVSNSANALSTVSSYKASVIVTGPGARTETLVDVHKPSLAWSVTILSAGRTTRTVVVGTTMWYDPGTGTLEKTTLPPSAVQAMIPLGDPVSSVQAIKERAQLSAFTTEGVESKNGVQAVHLHADHSTPVPAGQPSIPPGGTIDIWIATNGGYLIALEDSGLSTTGESLKLEITNINDPSLTVSAPG